MRAMNEFEGQSRRRFIKMVSFGTAVSALGGEVWQRTLMADAEPTLAGEPGVMKIKLSDFPALQEDGGSVRLGVSPVSGFPDFQPQGGNYPLLINRESADTYHVLVARCTHQSCAVPTYSREQQCILCFCHGSTFSISGEVISGQTVEPLERRAWELGPDNTLVFITDQIFNVAATVLTGVNGRLSLTFPAAAAVTFELSRRQNVKDPWVVVPFAVTDTGPINQTSIAGSGQPKTIYVDRANASGFYAVGAKVSQV
jgi:Rieske Fe-S protein